MALLPRILFCKWPGWRETDVGVRGIYFVGTVPSLSSAYSSFLRIRLHLEARVCACRPRMLSRDATTFRCCVADRCPDRPHPLGDECVGRCQTSVGRFPTAVRTAVAGGVMVFEVT